MSELYQKNKKNIYNYRVNHHEKFKDYQRILQRKYDNYKRIARIFRNILI